MNKWVLWHERISKWAEDRNLIYGSSPEDQMKKLVEEVLELHEGIIRDETREIVDAIGDIQVVLAVICAQLGLCIDACRETAWNQIKDRKGRLENGVFVKEE